MKKGILLISLGLVFCIVGFRLAPVWAVPFGFYSITNNVAGDVAIGEAQLSVDVTDGGSDQVLFTFWNIGPLACSITDIYFDDYSPRVLEGIDVINDAEPGVSFSEDDPPGNLPGGKSLAFPFVELFSASSDPQAEENGVYANGVNPGESVGILFDLMGSNTFDDVLNALQDTNELTSLRIGIHVQGFDSEGSESFVNNLTPGTPRSVPEPSTMLLLGVGLIGLAGIGRKKFVKK